MKLWPSTSSAATSSRLIRTSVASFALVLVVAVSAIDAGAQRATVRVPDDLACPRCKLTFQPTAVLVTPSDTTAGFAAPADWQIRFETAHRFTFGDTTFVGARPRIAMSPDGRIAVAPVGDAGGIAIFSPARRVWRVHGRAGEGPGEFRLPSRMHFGGADSLFIVDARLRRLTILADGKFSKAIPFPSTFINWARWNDGWIVSGPAGSSESFDFGAHVLDREGRVLKSFHRVGSPVIDAQSLRIVMHLDSRRNVWLLEGTTGYRAFKLDSTGKVLSEFSRSPAWLRQSTTASQAWVMGMSVDDSERLWVFGVRRRVPPDARQPSPGAAARNDTYESHIEVIDTKSGKVLSTASLPGFHLPVDGEARAVDGNRMIFWKVDNLPNGQTQFDLIRPRLHLMKELR